MKSEAPGDGSEYGPSVIILISLFFRPLSDF